MAQMKTDYEKLHAKLGDIAVLIEENYEDKEPLKDHVKASRQCFRNYIKDIHSALTQAEKEHKALEIFKNKLVNVVELALAEDLDHYNLEVLNEMELTQEEYDLLKEVFGKWED